MDGITIKNNTIIVHPRLCAESPFTASEMIHQLNKNYNYPIEFDFTSEGFQKEIIEFINDVVCNLITNHHYDIDRFSYHSGACAIETNIKIYDSLPFEYLPYNIVLHPTIPIPYMYKDPLFDRKIEPSIKIKKFLSMNSRPRTSRRLAFSWLIKNDLLDKSFYSFDNSNPRGHANQPLLEKYKNLVEDISNNFTEPMILSKKFDDFNTDDRKKIEDIYYFDNSYFSLVQETVYDESLNSFTGDIACHDHVLITEKTYRPIFFKHPFIIIGTKGILAGLREYGFKTFSPYFDESYDDIDDPVLRLETVLNEVKRLCNLSDEQWLVIQRELYPIIEYNYELLTSGDLNTTLSRKKK